MARRDLAWAVHPVLAWMDRHGYVREQNLAQGRMAPMCERVFSLRHGSCASRCRCHLAIELVEDTLLFFVIVKEIVVIVLIILIILPAHETDENQGQDEQGSQTTESEHDGACINAEETFLTVA